MGQIIMCFIILRLKFLKKTDCHLKMSLITELSLIFTFTPLILRLENALSHSKGREGYRKPMNIKACPKLKSNSQT